MSWVGEHRRFVRRLGSQPTPGLDIAEEAKQAAQAKEPVTSRMAGVAYTENDPMMQWLYEEARRGQFDLNSLRQLPDAWLMYLQGHRYQHVATSDDEWTKLGANAWRAASELERRHQSRRLAMQLMITTVAVMIAACLGVFAARTDPPPDPVRVQIVDPQTTTTQSAAPGTTTGTAP